MKIGELATKTGCKVETVRYYEREGLLSAPGRSEGNYRLYTSAHLDRLTFIRNCRTLDMTLDEIRQLLNFRDHPVENCAGVNELVDDHIEHVSTRIAALQALHSQLIDLRHRCLESREAAQCQILGQLGDRSSLEESPTTSHVGRSHDQAGKG
ncbi:MAG TPA: Cd(II)/Pb(II)-responsive transcriptional regulator [Pseudomonas xinjiangensis]|uniref:Cd(II)/Pb(II)-responsive transcriptional regulator n=2 Tax=root TaxID=1 RepID=A0A7V1FTZ8_9GAMM|nr:Cd(II)/Pb(II)-responsive transcriptional regulator [Halopseudomonas xinjiangensis]HEC46077.1 Cd(II)/Pb(II)-responsive transcriptional regulator [Halopseudomonas xinjiangensis]